MPTQVVTRRVDFGNEFDFGTIEPNKIRVKLGTGLTRDAASGVISTVVAAPTNSLTASGTILTSTVGGTASSLNLLSLVQAAETTTTLAYAAGTKTLTYTNEDLTVTNIDLSGLSTSITNALTTSGTSITSTVNGVASTLNVQALIQAAETTTGLTYAPATKILTYTNEDGVAQAIDLSALAVDVTVNGATYDAATMVLTLTDNDAGTPNITLNLSDLKKVSTTNSTSVAFTGTGETASPLTATVALSSAAGNLLSSTPTGLAVPTATVVSAVKQTLDVKLEDPWGGTIGYCSSTNV